MIFHYSDDYHPPAPVVEVTLVSVGEGLHSGPLTGFIDSGADGTIVPLEHLDEIRAPATVEMQIRSAWGENRDVLLYLVDVEIGGLLLPGMEVVGDELSNEVVLGRDVLNRLRVVLDGPNGMGEISESS